ncbi:hypothetical protein MSWAN_1532 [Methanobacterium paludis]|uniref:Uncharacterized protein n=1 Tax=Methanobacterium paludis (strain DSM 25820 / JCM 18151 / SWAN1) TaxID=868131 RepID=F6D8B2_METPW|nr:hypothetical protein MSWAN_1532 [Methanobacterium paludis]
MEDYGELKPVMGAFMEDEEIQKVEERLNDK